MEENIIQSEQENELYNESEFTPRKFEITKKDNVFAVLAIFSSIVTSVFGIWDGFRGGFTVSSILMLISFTAYLLFGKIKIKLFPLCCMILSVGVSLSFAVTSNGSVRFWSAVVLVALDLVWYTSLVDERRETGDLGLLNFIFQPLFKGILNNLPVSVRSLVSGNIKNSKKFGMAVLGLVISIPFLTVIIPLLISSDEAFSGMANMFSKNLLSFILKIVFGLILAVFVISYGLSLKKEEHNEIQRSEFGGIDNSLLISFLSVISVCYLAYMFSQLAYFFSAFSGFLPEDYKFNVATYARRGFFEMSIIAAINFALIFATVLISRKKDGKVCLTLKIMCNFIGVFTLIIIATALSKMFLYIGELGMTRLRITTSAFMIFLAIVFISLMLRTFIPKVRVIRTGLITAAVVLIALGTVNVNHIVADYNFNAYVTRDLTEIDVKTISDLGEEGVPYLIKLTTSREEDVREEAFNGIRNAIEDMYDIEVKTYPNRIKYKVGEKHYHSIGEWSIARSRAYKALDEYMKKHPEILSVETYGTEDYVSYY